MRDSGQRLVLLTIVLLAFAVRLYHLDFQSLWRDEMDAIRFAYDSLTTLLTNFTRPGWNGPLYYLLLRPWLAVAGDSEFALRFFSLPWGVLAVPLAYVVGRRLLAPPPAILASLLVALSPYLVWYSQEGKMYALVLALTLLSIYLYIQALEQGGFWRWMGHVVVTSLCLYVHVLAALIVPLQALLFVVWWPRYRARWRGWLAAMAALTLPYLPLALWEIPILLSGFTTGHEFVPLPRMLNVLLLAFAQGLWPVYNWPVIGVFMFLLLTGTILWGKRGHQRGWRTVVALLLWLFVPIVSVYLISLGMPIFLDRYLIWIAPAFYLLTARGVIEIGRRSRLLATVILVTLVVLNSRGLWWQAHIPIKSDFRAAAAYVRQHRTPDELIIFHISYARPTFEYYYGDSSPYADGITTDENTTEAWLDAMMEAQAQGHNAVWLCYSEAKETKWDEREMVKDWLERNGRRTGRAAFARVEVSRYELGP
jgi:mannosyltransferase